MRIVAFTRWDPLRDLLALHEQIGHLVGSDTPGWNPPVDLYETTGSFVLTAEVAGLSRDNIDIHAEENRVVIRGERSHGPVPCEQFHRVERGHGSFTRTFQLPVPIDTEGIRADLRNGILTVICPKDPDATARRIQIT